MPDKKPTQSNVKIIKADYKLKNKIGANVDLKKIFTEEKIKQANNIIEANNDEIVESLTKQMNVLRGYKGKNLSYNELRTVQDVSLTIKSNAGMANYPLASAIARSLFIFIENKQALSSEDIIVMDAHIDSLNGVFTNKITDDGGTIGTEILKSLSILINKYNR